MSWIDIGPISEIPLRGARLVKTPVGCVAVSVVPDGQNRKPMTTTAATSTRTIHKRCDISLPPNRGCTFAPQMWW